MTLKEIKKLSEKEFAERYPFFQYREWNRETRIYSLKFWLKEDDNEYHNVGGPAMIFYQDYFNGWNNLILCWAEKVREVLLKENLLNDFWVTDIKEKYGSLRICTNISNREIDDLSYMTEHLSKYVCYYCGHIGRVNEKKLVTYCSKDYWVSYKCKKCLKKLYWKIGRSPKNINKGWERETDGWIIKINSCYKGKESIRLLDCRRLLEGMML